VTYSDSESEGDGLSSGPEAAAATDNDDIVHVLCSNGDGGTTKENSTVFLQCQRRAGDLQPCEEAPVTSAVEDFFNLSEERDVSVADKLHEARCQYDSQQQSTGHSNCTAQFWTGDLPAEDWSHPEKIWGVKPDMADCNNGDRNVNPFSDGEVSKPKGYSSKRRQSNISSESQVSVESSVTSGKPCFMVHHKVAPHLHTVRNNTNRIPRKVLRVLSSHSGTVNRIHWNVPEHSNLLLTASMDATVRVWNVLSSRDCDPCIRTLRVHSKAVKMARWSNCGRQILSCSYDKLVKLTDVEHGMQYRQIISSQNNLLFHALSTLV